MKVLAFIFSLYILFLAVLPTLETLDLSVRTECCSHCCGNDCGNPSPEKQPQNNSCNDVCNPLLSCGTCIGFIVASPTNIFIVPQFVTIENSYSEVSPSQIALPVWQPPKIS